MLSVDIALPEVEELQRLVEQGLEVLGSADRVHDPVPVLGREGPGVGEGAPRRQHEQVAGREQVVVGAGAAGGLAGGLAAVGAVLEPGFDLVAEALDLDERVEAADLVVTDPVQAGVMAVMAVAETASFSLERLSRRVF